MPEAGGQPLPGRLLVLVAPTPVLRLLHLFQRARNDGRSDEVCEVANPPEDHLFEDRAFSSGVRLDYEVSLEVRLPQFPQVRKFVSELDGHSLHEMHGVWYELLMLLIVILLDSGAGKESGGGGGSALDGSGRGEQCERLLVLLLQLKQFWGVVLAPL